MKHQGLLLTAFLAATTVVAQDATTTPLQFYGYGTLECAEWSDDDGYLITGGSAGAFLWDVRTSGVARTFAGHEGSVIAVALAGNVLLTGSTDGTAKLWRLSDGSLIHTLGGHGGAVNAVDLSPDGSLALTGSADGIARRWNRHSGALETTYVGHSDEVLSVAFSSVPSYIATGSADNTALIWETLSANQVGTATCGAPVECVVFGPSGTELLTGSGLTASRWRDDGSQIWTTSWGSGLGNAQSLLLSPNGQDVFIGTTSGNVLLWGASTGSDRRQILAAGNNAPAVAVDFSPNGRHLLTAIGAPDNSLKVWAADDLPYDLTFYREPGFITSVACPKEGTTWVLTGSTGRVVGTGPTWNVGRADLWDASDGTYLGSRTHNGVVSTVAFAEGTTMALSGSEISFAESGRANLWRVPDRSHVRTFDHGRLFSASISPDGLRVLTGGVGGIKLWRVSDGVNYLTIGGPTSIYWRATFSPDGSRIVADDRNNVYVWWASGGPITDFPGSGPVFSPNGNTLLTKLGGDRFQLWNVADWTPMRTLTLSGHTGNIVCLAYSPDGTRILTGSDDRTAKLWDADTGSDIRTFWGHSNQVDSVAFAADGSKVLTGSLNDKYARLWHVVPSAPSLLGHLSPVTALALSWDAATSLVTAHVNGEVNIWNTADGSLLSTFSNSGTTITSVAISPDGGLVMAGTESNELYVWRTVDQSPVPNRAAHLAPVRAVAFSADGSAYLTAGEDGWATLWDIQTSDSITWFPHSAPLYSAAISDDGRYVLTGDGDGIGHLWDASTGAEIRSIPGHAGAIRSVAISANGDLALLGSDDTSATLWDATDGTRLQAFTGHGGPVNSVMISPNGRKVVAASDDGVFIWDASDGSLVRTAAGHVGAVTAADLSSDGTRVASGSMDGTARLWTAFAADGAGSQPVTRTADKVILVAGGGNYPGNAIAGQTQAIADRAYFACLVRGYTHDEIKYLSAFDDWQSHDANQDGLADVDAFASQGAFWSALDSWSSDTARVFIYLLDHGDYSSQPDRWRFRLNQTEYISARDLDAHLDALQTQTATEIILVVDCCFSGGFIRQCTAAPGIRRVVLSSTTPDDLAVFSPPVGAESFSFNFLSFAIQGSTINDCYYWTKLAFLAMGNPAGQDPWMDDNGDGVSDFHDGDLAALHVLGRYPAFGLSAPDIRDVASTTTVGVGDTVSLWAQMNSAVPTRSVWAVVVPESQDYTSTNPVTDLTRVDLFYNLGAGRWEAAWIPQWEHIGSCAVTYFAVGEDALGTDLVAFPVTAEIDVVAGDAYEVDDTAAQATEYLFSNPDDPPTTQAHNFHDPGDVDWLKFYGFGGEPYTLHVTDPGTSCNAKIELFDLTSGTMLLGQADFTGPGEIETFSILSLPSTGTYHWKVTSSNPSVYGDGTSYTLHISHDTGAGLALGTALPVSSRRIEAAWIPGYGADDEGYMLYRRQVSENESAGVSADGWTTVTPVPIQVRSIVDTDLQPETTYEYVVRIKTALGDLPACTELFSGTTFAEVSFASFPTPAQWVEEDAGAVSIPFRLMDPSIETVTVRYAIDGSATGGDDYSTPSGSVTFPPGETTTSTIVTVLDDSLGEPAETIVVTITDVINAGWGEPAIHTITIKDNDLTDVRRWSLYP